MTALANDPFSDEMERLGPLRSEPLYDRADQQRAPISATPPLQRLDPISLGDFLQMEFPPREMVLGPWLPVGVLRCSTLRAASAKPKLRSRSPMRRHLAAPS
jgi:hypothetical protein